MRDESSIRVNQPKLVLSGVAGQKLAPAVAFPLILIHPIEKTVPRRRSERPDQIPRPERTFGDETINHVLISPLGSWQHSYESFRNRYPPAHPSPVHLPPGSAASQSEKTP